MKKVENHWSIQLDYAEVWWQHTATQLCRSLTPIAIACDLTTPTRTQTSEQDYSDLMANNRQPSTPDSRNTPRSFSRGTQSHAFSWSTKRQNFGSFVLMHRFSRHLAYTFLGRLRREMPPIISRLHSLLSPFLFMGMITPVCQSFSALSEHHAIWHTRAIQRTLQFRLWAFQVKFHHSLQSSQPSVFALFWQQGRHRLQWWYIPPPTIPRVCPVL